MEKNKKCIKTYIGITGFMAREEVETMLKIVPLTSKKSLMVGILVNDITMKGLKTVGGRHPNIEEIKNIFISHSLVLNMIHYHTKDTDSLCDQLVKLTELSGTNLHGFQFNIVWPPKDEIKKYRSIYPDHATVLTIDGRALNQVENSTQLFVQKIKEYKGLIDYILLDKSCGYGIPLDIDFMRKYINILNTINFVADSSVKIVIAGGLNSIVIDKIRPLINEFYDLSIDAENNIRNQDDSLNLEKARYYLQKALEIFRDI